MPQTPFIGELMLFAGTFAPRGYALCNGQLMSIAQNQALFSILGTTYGGNGINTFGLPDLRGRITVGPGQGPGLSPYDLGEIGGAETHTLTTVEMPSHVHPVNAVANGQAGGTNVPDATALLATAYSAGTGNPFVPIYSSAAATLTMNAQAVGTAGSNQPHENRMPFLTLNWCIALEGIFPSRN
jgi:microcystin-dependent protein